MNHFTLHHGDMEDVLEQYEDNTFDSIVVDGPYGLGFMGKEWDNFRAGVIQELRKNHKPIDHKLQTGRSASMHSGKYDLSQPANFQFQKWVTQKTISMYRVLKPGGHLVSFCSTRTFHRLVCAIEDAGFEIRDTLNWVFASGFPKSKNNRDLGMGSALKPAFEPICLARKPLDGTLEENRLKWGTGYLNIDKCRVPGSTWSFGTQTDIRGGKYGDSRPADGQVFKRNVVGGELGRWPANILHDGSPEVLSVFPDSTGQLSPVSKDAPTKNGFSGAVKFGGMITRIGSPPPREDNETSAARFFYCAKTSRRDRNEGCENLPDKQGGMNSNTSGQHITPRDVLWKPEPVKNNHPTVKPTNLMRYLIRLVTPEGGLVLDPMMGSGSTGKAAMYEFCKFVGIDKEPDYINIAEARIRFALKDRRKKNDKKNQLEIF